MGGSSKTETKHETQSNTIDPMQMAQYQQNYLNAQNTVGALKPYTGQITAGFNPTQTQSQGILTSIGQDPRYQNANNSALAATQGILGSNIPTSYDPSTYGAATYNPTAYNASTYKPTSYNATTYDPSLLAGKDLSPYTNPYQKQVIDASISQNEYARNQAQVHDQQAATRAGSFQGAGTRQGVAMGETNAAYDRNNQQNLASLNQANYAQAREGALADIGAQNAAGAFNAGSRNAAAATNAGAANSADAFNAGALNSAGAFGASARNVADAANAGAINSASAFNATQTQNARQAAIQNELAAQGLKMNAAGQVVAINDAALNTAIKQGGILASVGDAQQAQAQKELTDAYNAYLTGQQLTLSQQQALNQALGIIPIQQTQTSDGTNTTKTSTGIGGILGGVASLGMGLASLPTSSLGGGILGSMFSKAPVTQGPFFPGAGS